MHIQQQSANGSKDAAIVLTEWYSYLALYAWISSVLQWADLYSMYRTN